MKLENCTLCNLSATRTKVVKGIGNHHPEIMFIGEAPGCVSGDTLIETAFRDKSLYPNGIPIKELIGKEDIFVYSFDVKSQRIMVDKVKKIWKTGRKEVWEIIYKWQFNKKRGKTIIKQASIRVTSNHLFLLKKISLCSDLYKGINSGETYLNLENGLAIGHSLQPFYRLNDINGNGYAHIGGQSSSTIREARFLLEYKLKRKLLEGEQCHHRDGNKLNDVYENLELQTIESHSSLHNAGDNNCMRKNPVARKNYEKAIHSSEYRERQSKRMTKYLADPINYQKRLAQNQSSDFRVRISRTLKRLYQIPSFYLAYLQSRQQHFRWTDEEIQEKLKNRFPLDNHLIISIKLIGKEDVYDIETEKYHNFAAQGIFVHNSQEDSVGEPFVGEAGQLLTRIINAIGLSRKEVYLSNVVKCRPFIGNRNRTPTDSEIAACKIWLNAEIAALKPKLIVLLGATAMKSQLGMTGISNKRGVFYTSPDEKWVYFVMYHPAATMYDKDKQEKVVEDILRLRAYLRRLREK